MEIKYPLDITHHSFLRRVEKNHVGRDEKEGDSDNIQNSN